jgi:hypothetical protein
MKANNYLITVTELKTMGYIPVESIPPDSNLIVSKATANTFYYIPYAEPWNSFTNDRCPKYQDFPISCYSYATVANTLEGNPDPVFISYQDCSGNFNYSSVAFGQALIINKCSYVSGDSGPMTGCGILANSIYAPGCEITYSTRCDIPTSNCTTTTSTTSTTTTQPPDYCLIVAGYVDESDLNNSYNYQVSFDYYDCNLNVVTHYANTPGPFTLPYDCYQSAYGYESYFYPCSNCEPQGGLSYLAGYTQCTTTTSTTTTQPPGCVVPNLPVTLYSINRYVYPNLFSRLYPYNSADGGRSWTILPCVSSLPDIDFRMISTSYDGTYILLAGKFPTTQLVSRYMYISTDGGNTISAGRDIYQELTGTQGYITAVAVSGNGQYMAMFAGSGVTGESLYKLIVSSDYGVNWSIRYSVANEGGTAYSPRGIAISNDGQYITGCIYGTGLYAGETKSKRIYSSNYGTSFTLSGGTNLQDFSDIAFSSSGQYQVIASLVGNTNGRVLLSTNYGANWTEKVFMVNYELSAIAITDNGSNIFASGSTGGYTFSKDYGSTFEAHYFPQTSITGLTMSNSLIGSDTLVTLYIAAATNYPASQIAYFSDTGGSYWCGAYINSLVNSAQSRGNI